VLTLSQPHSGARRTHQRHSTPFALLAAFALIALACLYLAQSAGAVVTSAGGHEFGVQPEAEAVPPLSEPLSYGNGPVVHSSAPYVLYWDHHPGIYKGSWEELISGFLANAGAASHTLDNDFSVIEQYHDTSGGKAAYDLTFRGAATDTDVYPASGCSEPAPCLTDAQIRTELTKYIVASGLPTGLNPASGPTPIYYVFTPPGLSVCLGATSANCSSPSSEHPLCSYHSFIPAGGGLSSTVLYAVEPWTAGNFGTLDEPQVSGKGCQDGSVLQEPNQVGLGPEGEYSTGLADLIINNTANQALSIATNPLFTAWHDAVDGQEVVDKCRTDFYGGELLEPLTTTVDPHTKAGSTHNLTINGRAYFLNDVYDQAAFFAPYPGVPCINGVSIVPQFAAQNTIRSGDPATFTTTESNVSLGIQKYNWSFGDGTGTEVNCENRVPTNGFAPDECTGASGTGTPNPVASTTHAYTYGGTYEVTLTVADYAGNTASVSHPVTVVGPAPPAPPPHKEETAGSDTATGSPAAGTTNGAQGGSSPAPKVTATQSVAPQKLASVLRSGIVVRYSVSEQVAGRFEVLLASSIAKRLGIHGSPATGLTKGTPAQTIIAKAILVTTKGGRSTYKIKFSKTTAARLRKVSKVSLMIRLLVHNAKSPTTTTVLNTVNLTR
jgi:PKD repeat protein